MRFRFQTFEVDTSVSTPKALDVLLEALTDAYDRKALATVIRDEYAATVYPHPDGIGFVWSLDQPPQYCLARGRAEPVLTIIDRIADENAH